MAQVSHRERLIEGAVACLQTKGFARTTARDIAAAAGANLASIGYHFGSKEALLNEALIRVFEQRNRGLGRAASGAKTASPLERMTALFVAVRKLFDAHRPLLVAFVEAMA
ncbi:MAG: TetR family transcriptional regulator, partial [Actinobacteria bacterium]|nr:TetR family transcriptional regulator [Actinomycetota bacterium]